MVRGYKADIMDYYEKVRNTEKKALKERVDQIKKLYPEIIELDSKIGSLCVQVSLMAIRKSANKEAEMNKARDFIEDLRTQKCEALVSHGYPIDYLNLYYHCKKCKDTGYIEIKKCSCYQRHLVNIYYKKSDIAQLLRDNNFSNFTLAHYRANKLDNERISPKENIQMIVNNIQENYLDNFDAHDRNLLFTGNPGTGKSFLSQCIAKDLLDKGFLVVYRTADELLSDLKEIKFKNNYEIENLLVNCDLLIIDDLGTEQITDFTISELFTFLNKKLLKQKKMLVSTNLSSEALQSNYDERIYSRLMGNFTTLPFFGDDVRLEMKKKKKRTQA
ncbi:MAG: ATP-binding protein [Sarcina sp.]